MPTTLPNELANERRRSYGLIADLGRATRAAKIWRALTLAVFAVLLLVVAVGCELQPVPIYLVDERAEPQDAGGLPFLVQDACAELELECYAVTRHERGSIKLRLVDDAGEDLTGHTEGVDGCRRGARAEPNMYTIAHEIGHLFTLEHVEDDRNLMFPSSRTRTPEPELTADQIADLQTEAAWYVGGC